MKPLFAIFGIFALVSCDSNDQSSLAADQALAGETYALTSWEADPNLGYDFAPLTQGSVSIDETSSTLTVHLVYDLFPVAFTADIETSYLDACGHLHIQASRQGELDAWNSKIEAQAVVYNLDASAECLEDVKSEVYIELRSQKLDGTLTSSQFYAGESDTEVQSSLDLSCTGSVDIDQNTQTEYEVRLSQRLRFDEHAGIPVDVVVRSRYLSRVAFQPGPWSDLVNGEARRFGDESHRTYKFEAGNIALEPGNGGINGQMRALQGTLVLETTGKTETVRLFCPQN